MVHWSRRETLALIAAVGGASFARAADNPFTPALNTLRNTGRYLPLYGVAQAQTASDVAEQFAAFVGDETLALRRAGTRGLRAPDLSGATASQAMRAIVLASRGRRVVMLNEAHVASRHRAFLAEVITALRAEGFTHLAAETFDNPVAPGQPSIRAFGRGRPLDPQCGFYTWDPVFADAVRLAADLGYRFAAYEQRQDQRAGPDGQTLTGLESIARRDQAEADNLADLLAADPEMRVLVHVGYSHLAKVPDAAGAKWLALRFKEKTGIDPLCVVQANTGAFGPHGKDTAYTQAVLGAFDPAESIVVREASGGFLGTAGDGADLAVFHPLLADEAGRPGWLARMPGRRRATVEVAPLQGNAPALLQAIHAAEPDVAVPADHLLLGPGQRSADLWLRPGEYRLRLETAAGHVPLKTLRV